MKKRNLFMSFTILCGLSAMAVNVRLDAITWQWQDHKPVGIVLGLLSAIFATQWIRYQKRADAALAQPIKLTWLRRLLFGSALLLTMLSAGAQTTWTRRYQGSGGRLIDVAYGAGKYVSVGDDGLIRIAADGITWTTQVASGNASDGLLSVVYAAGKFVAVGYGGRVLTSSDGLTWVAQTSGTTKDLYGITYGGSQFIAVGNGGIIIASVDGLTWAGRTSGTVLDFGDVTYANSQFVAVGDAGVIKTSPNGVTWTTRTSQTASDLRGVTAGGNGNFVAVGFSTVVSSADGATWTSQVVAGPATDFTAVAYNPTTGQFVAVTTTTNRLYTSPDGLIWTARPSGTILYLSGIQCINGQFIVVGEQGTIRSGINATDWTPLTITTDIQFRGVAHGNGHYVAVGSYPNDPDNIQSGRTNVAVTSTNGINYVLANQFNGGGSGFYGVTFGNGLFVTVGAAGNIQTSTDGMSWVSRYNVLNDGLYDIAYGGGQFVAVGSIGFFVRSTDGLTWTSVNSGSNSSYRGVVHANGQFVAAGAGGGGGSIGTSPDGLTWTNIDVGGSFLNSVAYGNGAYVAGGNGGAAFRSTNGTTWTVIPSFTGSDINHLTFGNGQFVTVGEDGKIFTSSDGLTWTARISNSDGFTLNGITHGNGLFVAVGQGATIITSPDDAAVPVDPGSFAITGVTTVSCNPISATQRQLVFSPQYAGLSGQPISFSVVNEMLPTLNAGPYTLNPYIDNPVITLKATQSGTAGEASFAYNWLSVCNGGVPPVNQAPTVANGIPAQNATVGQGFNYVIPANTFSDPNGDALTLSIAGLPNGLTLNGTTISGTPTTQGAATVTVTATDPSNLMVSTQFTLTVNPVGNPNTFAITGVTLVSCNAISATQRQLIFSPQYAGTNNQPISFSVVNEMVPTMNAGPYTLNMYIDNPVITLKATQSGTPLEASFVYNWFVACGLNSARLGVSESAEGGLAVRVLGNPVDNGVLSVEVRGAAGQPLLLSLSDMRGRVVGSHGVVQAEPVEEYHFGMGQQPAGLYLLRVSTAGQVRTVKVLKR